MLPDCFRVKNELRQKLDIALRKMVNGYLGIVAEAPRSIIHEGRRTAIVRDSGVLDETQMFQASVGFEIRLDEVPNMTAEILQGRMEKAAREMAKQMSEHFFKSISDSVEKIGNTVDGKGQGFTPELLFEVFKKIWIEFDPQGNPRMPTLTINPGQAPQVQRVFQSIDNDPELSARFAKLMDKKREEWRAREATRKLVG